MKILVVASEAAPYAKTGGLGDVIGALPRALAARGHEVLVVLPKYARIDGQRFGLRDTGRRIEVSFPGQVAQVSVHITAPAERLRYVFLGNPYFERRELYGEGGTDYRDNHKRFALLSAGALEAVKQLGFVPDLVHAHDWQAALVPLILKRGWAGRPAPFKARSHFTVHNLSFQGLFPRETMQELALPVDLFNPDALEFYGQVALVKAGLVFGDRLNTVSPTYAREIVASPETGAGLDGLVRHRQADLTGIMNGADYTQWNPETDPHLAQRYSAADLSGKRACKADLQAALGLTVRQDQPLCGAVGRLGHQKGYDLLAQVVPGLVERGVQVALLGMGEPRLEEELMALAHRYPGQVAVALRFDDQLAHKIEAGADLFLLPSRFEPCGLNLLYSLRYGTLPVARTVGGLSDALTEVDAGAGRGWGFGIGESSAQGLLAAMERALQLYRDPPQWAAAQRRAMAIDHSWDRAAEAYEAVFRG